MHGRMIPGDTYLGDTEAFLPMMLDTDLGILECPICGFEFRVSELILRWDGLKVCLRDFEERHPLDDIHHKSKKAFIRTVTRPD